jgi:ubiquinone/menaquinone biosynthesis C-methylase UbiE
VGKIDYDARLHAVYAAGRTMSSDALRTWMDAFARHLPATRPLEWLDVGSGTGRMTPSLANTFGGPVHGIEPSDRMRARAVADARHPAVTYEPGTAEQIPLGDASCDAALAFFVWHHVADPERGAHELRRVVKRGGTLFVQTNFSDRMPDVWWFRVLPEWRRVDAAQFRTQTEVQRDFLDAGWTLVACDEVTWMRSASLAEDVERLRLRSVSVFEYMTQELADAGFTAIEVALPELDAGPQYETSTLLVFR